ncbi:hypothetical protein [Cellulomonas wangsupingiae]|uniref:Uncharacterized protein n=1 Tax=Cellulomonas wangsupingiae TaxID=2968085 RepID=A0ABY5K252_9CELL|nr:hypothetical protein [Cellulomonas wangsupingiae]MCC2333303.1 hypothetical protein [Cellulomonas wangsupingiae]UUI63506.1 hypothetical protein NP075_10035 [Cellulomonas wangsupingiae]
MSERPHAGRHEADDGASSRSDAWPAFVGFLSYAARRWSLGVAYLAWAAVAGGIGYVVAPLIGQPEDAGFWGGFAIAIVLIAIATLVCVTGHALGWRRFDWVERVYSYLT